MTAWKHCHIICPQIEVWPLSSPPTEASNVRKHSQEHRGENCSAAPAFAAFNPAEEQEKTFCTAFKILLIAGRRWVEVPYTKLTVTTECIGPHFFFPLVSSTNTFWSKEVAGLPAEGLAGSHGPLTSVSWGEACNHDALPGYRATMTPHMPSFCTTRGLSLAETEICRSICKTRIVTETSRMPKMVFISMHLQHSAEACNREPQCPCSLCIATITHSTKPTLEVLPWPWEENVGWIPDMISILAFCSIWGRTLQRSSGISPAVLLLLPRSAWRGRWRWTVMQISRHQARPKAVWLPGHRDGCVGRSAFVPAAKDPLREGRQQGRWKLVIQDTSIFLDSLLFYSS